jgi:hypothetical protein
MRNNKMSTYTPTLKQLIYDLTSELEMINRHATYETDPKNKRYWEGRLFQCRTTLERLEAI